MMRVTDKITTGTFLTNNRRMRSNLIGSYTRIMTQRRFNRVSEDSINGAKALIIRRDLRDLDIYDSNLSSVKQLFTEAETNLTAIAHDLYIPLEEQLTGATNGTHDQMDMNIFATSLDQIADSMVEKLNGDFSERQIFGGTNNSTPPFAIGRYVVTKQVDVVDNDGNPTGETVDNVVYPPYYYDYYVGADATQKQVDAVNEVLNKLAAYNNDPNSAPSEGELSEMNKALNRFEITLSTSDDKTYSAYIKAKDGSKVQLLAEDGTVQELKCTVTDGANAGDPKTVKVDVAAADGDVAVSEQKENEVKSHFKMVDVPRSITYNGIPVDFDVMRKMTDANGEKFDIQIGDTFTIKALNSDFTWGEGKEIAPDVEAAIKGRDNSLIFPGSDPIYVDIGIGIKYDKDNDYKVDPQTALDVSFNGASIMGCGIDDEGYSKNLAQLVLDAARALRNGDQATPNAIIDKANAANNNILIEIANLGSKYNNIEFYQQRNEISRYNLRERQNLVEGTDMETEISYFESLQAAYEASLKVGTQVIPNSIFNYI